MSYALLSVSDKTGIVNIAEALIAKGIKIISTGGTSQFLKKAEISVIDIDEHTGFPEILGGRVKTLHPKIHGGLLTLRDNSSQTNQANQHDISMIDFVVVNLYPFEKTIAKSNVALKESIENIDIGGPSMLRSAAKNYQSVTVVSAPEDYDLIIEELKDHGKTSLKTREYLAVKAFTKTALYDTAISSFLSKNLQEQLLFNLHYSLGKELRYGENPHQKAALYLKDRDEACPANATILNGKEMSYNNYLDADAGWEAVMEIKDKPAVCIIKHGNPCGFANGDSLAEALEMAWEGDIISSFGSVIAFNRTLDLASAKYLENKFVEIVMAPDYENEALTYLKQKSKNLRILKITGKYRNQQSIRSIRGGLLVQDVDCPSDTTYQCVTKKQLNPDDLELYQFTFKVVKHTKSNAIAVGGSYKPNCFHLLGIGAGQPNRVDSIRKLALTKVKENLNRWYNKNEEKQRKMLANVVLASDAFFPFADNIKFAHEGGIQKIIQPGGSLKDRDVINACDKYGICMLMSGTRHFKH